MVNEFEIKKQLCDICHVQIPLSVTYSSTIIPVSLLYLQYLPFSEMKG